MICECFGILLHVQLFLGKGFLLLDGHNLTLDMLGERKNLVLIDFGFYFSLPSFNDAQINWPKPASRLDQLLLSIFILSRFSCTV